MDNPIPRRLAIMSLVLALFLLVGWEPDRDAALPDDSALAAGDGVARGERPTTISSRLHSIRGVAYRAEESLSMPDLSKPLMSQERSDFADSAGMGSLVIQDDIDLNDARSGATKTSREADGLNAESRTIDRFLKESEGSMRQGWLGGRMGASDSVEEVDPDRMDDELDLDFDAEPYGDSTTFAGEGRSGDGYDDYLYDQMKDSGKEIGFESLENFEIYQRPEVE